MIVLHLISNRFSHPGGAKRSLCGIWNAPSMVNPRTVTRRRLPKETCPACRRLGEGGKE